MSDQAEYQRLLAEREALIESGVSPDELVHPIDPDNPDPLLAYELELDE